MGKRKKMTTVSGQLREAIRASGQSLYEIAKESGVANPILYRFMSGQRAPSLATIDRLCAYLKLELVKVTVKKGKGKP
jgi:transcriptional regulator with XRE-family HTH domain